MDILGTISSALDLAAEIMKIVAEKGDDAADVRLGDLKGWTKLKGMVLNEPEAVRRFREKLAARRAGSGG